MSREKCSKDKIIKLIINIYLKMVDYYIIAYTQMIIFSNIIIHYECFILCSGDENLKLKNFLITVFFIDAWKCNKGLKTKGLHFI